MMYFLFQDKVPYLHVSYGVLGNAGEVDTYQTLGIGRGHCSATCSRSSL